MLAVIFPGQGSQAVGMGRELADWSPAAREVFAVADEVLGFALSELCFAGPEAALTATEVAQPALLTCGWAAWQAVAERLPEPAYSAGHSLGEYTACLLAGAIDFPTALRLVRRRGELMRDAATATPGAMAAVLKLDDEQVASLCEQAEGVVQPANYNSPGQVVISGEAAAVAAVMEAAKAAGGRAMPLKVSGAFHSPLMAAAATAMADELAAAPFAEPRLPVIQNVTAEPTTDPATLRANLAAQVTGSVRWTETVRKMRDVGVSRLVECGPGSVLAGLTKRIDGSLACDSVGDQASAEAVLAGLGG